MHKKQYKHSKRCSVLKPVKNPFFLKKGLLGLKKMLTSLFFSQFFNFKRDKKQKPSLAKLGFVFYAPHKGGDIT